MKPSLFKPLMLALMVALPLTALAEYKIQNNGTEVLDTETGLTWQRCPVGQKWNGSTCAGKAAEFTFDEVKATDGNRKLKGWRVPSIRELASLRYCSNGFSNTAGDLGDGGAPVPALCAGENYQHPTINTKAFSSTPDSLFWSTTPYPDDSAYAWYVNFRHGVVTSGFFSGINKGHVRLVR